MIRPYLHDHLDMILSAALAVAIFDITALLYEEFRAPAIYATIILIVIYALLLAAEYPRYVSRMRYLNQLNASRDPEECAENLPESLSCEIQTYQQILKTLSASYRQKVSDEDEMYRDRSDYFAMWAHQIKTPIAAMHLLIDDQEMPEVKDQLFRIEEYVSIVMHYLKTDDVSKDFVLKQYDLDPIIEQAVRHYSSVFIRKKLKLNFERTGIKTVTDEKWLLFVIEQILSNSLKYTEQGSITIRREDNNLVIQDTGCGIAKEDIPMLFEHGYTGYNGRMDKRSTGLGLYLCYKVLDRLGHTIRIESETGKGTSVYIGINLSES